mmetsp:Transcript_12168/g.22765  ORF Transcript_12168/g.22765 Transcript_12168/m.22765 type:complete len:159 (-) Transcript_12168:95-571(-)
MSSSTADDIKKDFELFDQSKTGTIERSDLAEVLRMLDPTWDDESIDGLFACLDENSDGHIQYNEFVDYVFESVPEGGRRRFLTPEDEEKLKIKFEERARAAPGWDPNKVYTSQAALLHDYYNSGQYKIEIEAKKAAGTYDSDDDWFHERMAAICEDSD